MIFGRVKQVIVMEIYGPEGEFLGKQAKYIYQPLLMWYELVAGVLIGLILFTQFFL